MKILLLEHFFTGSHKKWAEVFKLYSLYLYRNKVDFLEKSLNALLNFRNKTENEMLSDFVARYDWSILAGQYDQTFQNIIDEYHAV